ncbi:MAG: uroporphyrinogen-III C-methyltransferase [Sulfuriflexus sp.]|nr:uroporphyrinogen-III C-methyltransferase [Sulfuriflexus sp.]
MDFFPIFMNLQQRNCLIVGGGEVATRKASLLLDAHAQLVVIAPELTATLSGWLKDGKISHEARAFTAADVDGKSLIIAATDDEAINQAVHTAATAKNIPVNVVDNPELCTFIVPSIVDRSPVIAAISTGGASPVLARMIRSRLESLLPSAYGRLAKMTAGFRDRVKQRFENPKDRRLFWERVLEGPAAEMVFAGRDSDAETEISKSLAEAEQGDKIGEVYLIGAGPGDPDLLTFRALRLMQQADVVVHDRLVSQQIIDLARRDAERIYVGKERDNHAVPQEDINHLLVRLAKEGKRVCRLKGGDPFIFGRGGEEIDTLVEEGVSFQVVPGITAASGAASYTGIPLTHRDYSQSVVFATGHLKNGMIDINWPGLVQPNQTLVFYMGLVGIKVICKELMAHGMSPDMPIALVQKATTPEQKLFTGSLANMHEIVDREDIKPPTLIIVGEVVKLHKKLNWYSEKS